MATSSTELVDDRDPRLEYVGNWTMGGHVNFEYLSSTHSTSQAGSQVRITFKGSSVAVRGTVSNLDKDGKPLSIAPMSTYSIDGSPIQTFSPPLPNDIAYRQVFFQASNLDNNQHVLVMTSIVSNAIFCLDYVQITSNEPTSESPPANTPGEPVTHTQLPSSSPPPPPNQSTPPSVVSTPVLGATNTGVSSGLPSAPQSIGATHASVSSVFSPTPQRIASSTQGGGSLGPQGPSQTSSISSAPFTTKSTSKGAIAGGAVGGIVVISIIGLLFWLYRREVKARKMTFENSKIQAESSNNMNRRWTQPPLTPGGLSPHGGVSPFTDQHAQYNNGSGGPREKNIIDFAQEAESPLVSPVLSSGYTITSGSPRENTMSRLTGSSVPLVSLYSPVHTPSTGHVWEHNERTEDPNNRTVFPQNNILTPVSPVCPVCVTNHTHLDIPPAYQPI